MATVVATSSNTAAIALANGDGVLGEPPPGCVGAPAPVPVVLPEGAGVPVPVVLPGGAGVP
ncbi:hypothetical protein NUG22_39160, partial [Saccharothrix longispora]|nr:hypothetical protein [Saccharothrix longispora]